MPDITLTCKVCGAEIMSDTKKCPFCDSLITETPKENKKPTKKFFPAISQKISDRIRGKDSVFFNPNVCADDKLMALCAYFIFLIFIPLRKRKKNKSEFLIMHINQGIGANLILIPSIIIVWLKDAVSTLWQFQAYALLYIVATIAAFYAMLTIVYSLILVLRGETKEFPILKKIKFIKSSE